MHKMQVLFIVPFLLLIACRRQPAQQTAQAGTQTTATQAPQPPPDQAAPPVTGVPAPADPVPVAQQAPPAGPQPGQPPQQPTQPMPPPGQAAPSQPASAGAAAPAPSVIWIPPGTVWRVRLENTLDTRRNRPGDRFTASLIQPIVVQGTVVVPGGVYCSGHLIESKPSGRLKGRARISLTLDSFDLNGMRYDLHASRVVRVSGRHRKRNLVLIGGGSGVGAAIGAVAGGPAGALIGAGAGGASGTAAAAITGRKNVRLPVETVLAFSQQGPVPVRN